MGLGVSPSHTEFPQILPRIPSGMGSECPNPVWNSLGNGMCECPRSHLQFLRNGICECPHPAWNSLQSCLEFLGNGVCECPRSQPEFLGNEMCGCPHPNWNSLGMGCVSVPVLPRIPSNPTWNSLGNGIVSVPIPHGIPQEWGWLLGSSGFLGRGALQGLEECEAQGELGMAGG